MMVELPHSGHIALAKGTVFYFPSSAQGPLGASSLVSLQCFGPVRCCSVLGSLHATLIHAPNPVSCFSGFSESPDDIRKNASFSILVLVGLLDDLKTSEGSLSRIGYNTP